MLSLISLFNIDITSHVYDDAADDAIYTSCFRAF
jgi:hypothetical protein